MRIHSREIFKRNSQFILFIATSVLCLISVAVNLRALSKTSRPMIIGIDANGTRIVTDQADPIYKTEAVTFIQKFLFNVYNFDPENFMKRIGLTTTMMSEGLWKTKRSEILDLKNKVERDSIRISGQIQKMTLDDSGIYHGLVLVKELSRMNEQVHLIGVSIKLKTVSRTQDNPYGLEVDSYEEAPIRN